MKLVCSRNDFAEGISIVQKAVPARTSVPILEGVLLEAEVNGLKMTGNDLEMGIECIIEAKVTKEGSIVINSRILGEIARKLPDADVSLELTEAGVLLIDCENSHFEIKGIQTTGYPELPDIKKENAFKIGQDLLKDMIRKTIFAVGVDENRPVLTGTYIEAKDGELAFVSCDSFRVALRKTAIGASEAATGLNVIVPGKTLGELAKILGQSDGDVSIYSTGSQILFDMGKCRLVSRLIRGEYFKYRSFLPQESETEITVRTDELLDGIERASLIITAEERRFPVKFDIRENRIIVSTNTDIGAVREEIKGTSTGREMEIYFNPRYFIEALRVIEEEEILLGFTTGICAVKAKDKDSFVYLIVPLRK